MLNNLIRNEVTFVRFVELRTPWAISGYVVVLNLKFQGTT